MFAIGIIVTPTVQPSNVYQEVDFLGPILEKTAFDLMVEEATPQAETLYARSALFLDGAYLKPKGPRRKALGGLISEGILKGFAFLGRSVKDAGDIPAYLTEGAGARSKSAGEKTISFLEGPAGKREVIFKPETPTVPRALWGDAAEYMVKLKFFVGETGNVYDPKPIVSSGYPEIDLQAIRFLKRWRFSPLGKAKKTKGAVWGIAAVKVLAV